MLEKIDKLARPEDVWEAAGNLGFGFASAEHPGGRESFVAKGLSVGHAGQPPLIEGLDWTLHRGDRVGIVGPNGAGKTTLAKVLLGKARPLAGLAELGYRVSPGYLDQKLEGIRDERTLIEEVQSVRPDFKPEEARNALGRYRFLGDDAHRAAGGLSGGERCRLAMLKLSLVPCNLLLLDEPTNHLDIPAQEVLERALAEYEGTLLVVSHDRDFLDAVTTRTLLVDDGKAALHEGCYSRARARWTERAKAAASATAPPPAEEAAPPKGAQTREASRSRRSELQKLRNRKGALERNIEALEARSGELHEQLAEDPAGDWERLHRLSAEEREVAARLERRVQEWERVCTRLESLGGASS
jgi:ATP-binding cassette subfamily F protein 3